MEQYSTIGYADQYIGNQLNNVGGNLKINSKIFGILLALFAIGMVISAASAVDLANEFKNEDFGVNVASGTDFNETVNIDVSNIKLAIFENSGSTSSDANSIIYFKDYSADKKEISGFIDDLEKNGKKVEETDKYVVLENTHNFNSIDIGNDLDGIFNFVGNIFSSGDGLNLSADGNSISLSGDGLKVSDADGENVSISTDGISVSGSSASGNETVNVSSDVDSNIEDSQYSIYLKNSDNDKVIVISGNNLELLKEMAESASFNEN